VLGLKAEIDLIFTGYARSKQGLHFFHYINHSSIHYSITPILQVLLTTSFDKEGRTADYQRR
jgi:hypothetical protein